MYFSRLRLPDRDIVRLQCGAQRLVECNPGVAVGYQRRYFGGLRRRQIPLLLDDKKRRGSAQGKPLLLCVKQLLLEDAIVDRGLITGASLLEGDGLIGDVDCDLVYAARVLQLGLTKRELINAIIGLRLVIAHITGNKSAGALRGEIASKRLAHSRSESAHKKLRGNLTRADF